MPRLPRKTSEAKIGRLRRDGLAKAGPRSRKDRSNWERTRLDYAKLEAAKYPVGSVLYKDLHGKENYKKEIRVAILPWSDSGYVDIRVYINGKSTGQGVLCHIDRWQELLTYLVDADRTVQMLAAKGLIDTRPLAERKKDMQFDQE